jgi:ABC-2 type transport system permease protein
MSNIRIMRHAFLVGIRDFQMFWTWRTWIFGWLAASSRARPYGF